MLGPWHHLTDYFFFLILAGYLQALFATTTRHKCRRGNKKILLETSVLISSNKLHNSSGRVSTVQFSQSHCRVFAVVGCCGRRLYEKVAGNTKTTASLHIFVKGALCNSGSSFFAVLSLRMSFFSTALPILFFVLVYALFSGRDVLSSSIYSCSWTGPHGMLFRSASTHSIDFTDSAFFHVWFVHLLCETAYDRWIL